MTTVAEIERAVAALQVEDLAEFRRWFATFESERFDGRIAEDALSGRLDGLAEEALAEFKQGSVREL